MRPWRVLLARAAAGGPALLLARVLLAVWAVGLALTAWELGQWRQELSRTLLQLNADAQFRAGYRVVYAPVRLDAYAASALPDSVLTQLTERFAIARRAGLKLVPRFLYNYPESETEYRNVKDAPLTRVLGHIAQLKPVLTANADVIAYLQAGFIGAWGEWHTSSNGLTALSPRTAIRDALLDALPGDRFLQLRYPAHLMQWAPQVPAWRDGSAASRIGVHNDCFLASTTDVGTYSENASTRARERDYVAAVSAVTPFGGETCNPADEPNPAPRTSRNVPSPRSEIDNPGTAAPANCGAETPIKSPIMTSLSSTLPA